MHTCTHTLNAHSCTCTLYTLTHIHRLNHTRLHSSCFESWHPRLSLTLTQWWGLYGAWSSHPLPAVRTQPVMYVSWGKRRTSGFGVRGSSLYTLVMVFTGWMVAKRECCQSLVKPWIVPSAQPLVDIQVHCGSLREALPGQVQHARTLLGKCLRRGQRAGELGKAGRGSNHCTTPP